MTRGHLVDWLVDCAKEYAPDAPASVDRNLHMNDLGAPMALDRKVTDAIVVDFVNFLAARQGLDLALYTSSLYEPGPAT